MICKGCAGCTCLCVIWVHPAYQEPVQSSELGMYRTYYLPSVINTADDVMQPSWLLQGLFPSCSVKFSQSDSSHGICACEMFSEPKSQTFCTTRICRYTVVQVHRRQSYCWFCAKGVSHVHACMYVTVSRKRGHFAQSLHLC